ncbi:MAG: hypothetical protein K2F63_03350, partial [Muribaculaceae bacterium]|nr:hypothetical protein [Muribaculaceae bacterium]
MDFNETDNPREDLYRRFRRSLSQPVGERYFDEDELVEIFDYAGDLDDEYVRMEALFCGARLYPESVRLAERRALLYLDTYDENDERESSCVNAYLADNPERSTPIFDITRLEANPPADGNAALDFLMEQYQIFTDEEIIRLIDLASDINCYDWLKTRLPQLRKKVRYLPSLLYEMMQEANDMGDDETVIALAEELIEMEPFTVQYWCALLRAQVRAGREEDARTTFDYAKDLASDNIPALMTLFDIIYSGAPYLMRDTIDVLNRLKNENPDEFGFIDCMCAMLVQMGRSDQAIRELKQFVRSHPDHDRAVRQLLMCNVRDAAIYTEAFYLATDGKGFDEATLDEIVNTLLMRTSMVSLDALLTQVAARRELQPSEIFAWSEALYTLHPVDYTHL